MGCHHTIFLYLFSCLWQSIATKLHFDTVQSKHLGIRDKSNVPIKSCFLNMTNLPCLENRDEIKDIVSYSQTNRESWANFLWNCVEHTVLLLTLDRCGKCVYIDSQNENYRLHSMNTLVLLSLNAEVINQTVLNVGLNSNSIFSNWEQRYMMWSILRIETHFWTQ